MQQVTLDIESARDLTAMSARASLCEPRLCKPHWKVSLPSGRLVCKPMLSVLERKCKGGWVEGGHRVKKKELGSVSREGTFDGRPAC